MTSIITPVPLRLSCLGWPAVAQRLAILGPLFFCGLAARCPAAPDRPNIVFILADDLGINDLNCYGRKDHSTPNVDKLAAQGMRFATAYAQPTCSPSRAALLTGKDAARLHLTDWLPGRPDCPSQMLLQAKITQQLPLAETTLAEEFKKAGYITACIGKWHLGGRGFMPEDQGFDVVHAGRASTVPSDTEGGKGEFDLTRQAEDFLVKNKDRPFFLFLSHYSPHIPYAAKKATLAKNAAAFDPLYAAVIESLDDTVGRLLRTLESLNLDRRTIVVFTSDNGGLKGPEMPYVRITHNTPYRAGKGFVYEGGLRVPLIIRWPDRIASGKVIDGPVSNTDWMPTLLALAGLPPPQGIDGQSFAKVLLGQGDVIPRPLFWHIPHYTNQGGLPGGAVRDGVWKYIETYDTGRSELYNLADDPGEVMDLSSSEPKRTALLREKLAGWRQAVGAQINVTNPGFEPALYSRLYRQFDPSRYDPLAADLTQRAKAEEWMKLMDAVMPKPQSKQRDAKP